ncbi:MAG: hypothetical protein BM564_03925 [Bacteroidetes bacterium MedPE-SWsnd-G2]|nr:MAG: hypothetical protein BM564_03925 [Bacteroidetes bacterium MedPE-SWsnd-G2]
MNWAFDIAYRNRVILNSFLEKHTLQELNTVPEGFSNSIIWNIAHVIVTQQLLVYGLSNVKMLLTEQMIERYRKGSKTEKDVTPEELEDIRALLFSTLEQTKKDYANGVFKTFNSYTTSTNSTMTNVDEAIQFNNFHEGIHLGYILAQRKSI